LELWKQKFPDTSRTPSDLRYLYKNMNKTKPENHYIDLKGPKNNKQEK
jgi:hypothetical protein